MKIIKQFPPIGETIRCWVTKEGLGEWSEEGDGLGGPTLQDYLEVLEGTDILLLALKPPRVEGAIVGKLRTALELVRRAKRIPDFFGPAYGAPGWEVVWDRDLDQ